MRHFFIKNIIGFFLISFYFSLSPVGASALSKSKAVKQGTKLYGDKDYEQAVTRFEKALDKEPESGIINFDLGTALYKKGDYEKALDHLRKALLSDDQELKQKTHYNLGNVLYKSGIAKENQDLEGAISSLENSLIQYEGVLQLNSEDKDAQLNHDFVKKELERLRKKLKKQQQKKQQQKQQDQKNKKGQQKKQQQQGQPQKEQQGQQQKEQQGEQQKQEQQNQEQGSSQKDQQKEKSQEQKAQQQSGAEKQNQQKDQQQEKQNQPQSSQNQKKQEREKQSQGTHPQSQQSGEETSESQSQPVNPQELTKQEAQMLLRKYQQTEEPKGMLNFYKSQRMQEPTLKDW